VDRRGYHAAIIGIGLLTGGALAGRAHAHRQGDVHVLPGLASDTTVYTPSSETFSLSVPMHSSLPTAYAKLYLDFDGDFTSAWGSYAPGVTPAYDIDGDASTFSTQELTNIHHIWSYVAEAFSPFKLDVTTVDPGNLDDKQTLRVVIGGDGKNGGSSYWTGSKAGGIAKLGGFYNAEPNTMFVFPGNLGNGLPRYVADAAVHEAGHGFGLSHQSTYDDDDGTKLEEYNPGTPAKAPSMGLSYYSTRALWWYGPSLSASFYQDDVAGIADTISNGFGYRPDDHGSTHAGATPLTIIGNSFAGSGVIEQIEDADFFSVYLDGASSVSINVAGAEFGQMLDASLALYAADGELLQLVDTLSLNEFLNITLPAGTYDIAVLSHGSYGDIGQFSFTGTITPVPEPLVAGLAVAILMLRPRRRSTSAPARKRGV
jgi:hypothetical protein